MAAQKLKLYSIIMTIAMTSHLWVSSMH